MLKNRLKELLDADQPAFGLQLRFGSPAIVELVGLAGFDWVLIDSEHAPQTPVTIQNQLQAAGCTPTTPVVRIGKNDPALIHLYLDMGAMGIAVPFINTPEEARLGAEACRYPPQGTRGWGPHRAAGYGLHAEAYTEKINDLVMYLPIIETAEAIENIEGIMAVDGVDSCIVGPVDLCISLGIPFQFDHPAYLDALQRVRDAAQRAGKPAGLPLLGALDDQDNIRQQVEQGARLLLLGGDEPYIVQACRKALENHAFLKK
jgi:4-hydroxy-2-oxoheptanedioate aldolase